MKTQLSYLRNKRVITPNWYIVLLYGVMAILFFSCGTIKPTQDRIDEEFEVYGQSLRAERDVYRVALEICKEN